MRKKALILAVLMTSLAIAKPVMAAEEQPLKVGMVDFRRCLEESKFGKSESNQLEALRKQLGGTLEGTERELQDLATKLRDPDYLDSLSPEAEEQVKVRWQTLQQEMQQQQQQFYQIVQQAEYKLVTDLSVEVMAAAQKAAREQDINLVLREDAAFYFPKAMDLTSAVIAMMDGNFSEDAS
jgi:outer membrane protein